MLHIGDQCYISGSRYVLRYYFGVVESYDYRGMVTLKLVVRHGQRIVVRVHSTKLRLFIDGNTHSNVILYMQEGNNVLVLPDNWQAANVELLNNDDYGVYADVNDESTSNGSEVFNDGSTSDGSEVLTGTCPECGSTGLLGNFCSNSDCGEETGNIYAH